MTRLTYMKWSEYLELTTPEEKRDWIHRRNAIKRRMRERRIAERLFRDVFNPASCDHTETKVVTLPAEEFRDRALDEITEIRCIKCDKLVGLLA